MEGDRCVYGRWAIYITSPLIVSEIERIRTPNRRVVISFLQLFFLIKGKRVNAQL